MRLFLDTANIEEIREINRWGVLAGVTTNPSLIAKEGRTPSRSGRRSWPRSTGTCRSRPPARGRRDVRAGPAPRRDGAERGREGADDAGRASRPASGWSSDGIRINVTLVFSPAQAILAAEIGAYIVSPFLGRHRRRAADGMHVLRRSATSMLCRATRRKVLAASLRHPMHVVEAALAGADIATMPFEVFTKLVKHPLTDIGLERFQQDWDGLQNKLGTRRKELDVDHHDGQEALEAKVLPELQQIARRWASTGVQRLEGRADRRHRRAAQRQGHREGETREPTSRPERRNGESLEPEADRDARRTGDRRRRGDRAAAERRRRRRAAAATAAAAEARERRRPRPRAAGRRDGRRAAADGRATAAPGGRPEATVTGATARSDASRGPRARYPRPPRRRSQRRRSRPASSTSCPRATGSSAPRATCRARGRLRLAVAGATLPPAQGRRGHRRGPRAARTTRSTRRCCGSTSVNGVDARGGAGAAATSRS